MKRCRFCGVDSHFHKGECLNCEMKEDFTTDDDITSEVHEGITTYRLPKPPEAPVLKPPTRRTKPVNTEFVSSSSRLESITTRLDRWHKLTTKLLYSLFLVMLNIITLSVIFCFVALGIFITTRVLWR